MVLLIWGTVRFDKIDPPLEMSLKTYRDASVMLTKTPKTTLKVYETFLYYLTALAMEIVHEKEPNSTQGLILSMSKETPLIKQYTFEGRAQTAHLQLGNSLKIATF